MTFGDAAFDARIHDFILRETGVLEPDEPTDVSHAVWMAAYYKRLRGEFTPHEREKIRLLLGLAEQSQGNTE